MALKIFMKSSFEQKLEVRLFMERDTTYQASVVRSYSYIRIYSPIYSYIYIYIWGCEFNEMLIFM